jgi:hypothetical protein
MFPSISALLRKVGRLEMERRARAVAWNVLQPPGLTIAGAMLWGEIVAEMADASDDHSRLVLYHVLCALDAECVELMLRVRGEGTT